MFAKIPTSFCCTEEQTFIIADQFFAKYVYGLSVAIGEATQNMSNKYQSMLKKVCPLKPFTNMETIDNEIFDKTSRSANGVLYAIGKIALAAQPWAQSETCLICAPDTVVSDYYNSSHDLSAS